MKVLRLLLKTARVGCLSWENSSGSQEVMRFMFQAGLFGINKIKGALFAET